MGRTGGNRSVRAGAHSPANAQAFGAAVREATGKPTTNRRPWIGTHVVHDGDEADAAERGRDAVGLSDRACWGKRIGLSRSYRCSVALAWHVVCCTGAARRMGRSDCGCIASLSSPLALREESRKR